MNIGLSETFPSICEAVSAVPVAHEQIEQKTEQIPISKNLIIFIFYLLDIYMVKKRKTL